MWILDLTVKSDTPEGIKIYDTAHTLMAAYQKLGAKIFNGKEIVHVEIRKNMEKI